MSNLPVPIPERESMTRHRRQFWQQIMLPFILAILIFIALAVLIVMATFSWGGDVARWAAISTIWLVIPIMFLGVILLALFGGLVYGLARLLGITPRYTGMAQYWLLWLNDKIRYYADQLVEPVLSIKSWLGIFIKEDEKKNAAASGENRNGR